MAYFTDPHEYEGGELQLQCNTSLARLPGAPDVRVEFGLAADQSLPEDTPDLHETTQVLRLVGTYAPALCVLVSFPNRLVLRYQRFGAGASVAFPSKTLEHRVTPVTRGERRSLLLLCRRTGEAGALIV